MWSKNWEVLADVKYHWMGALELQIPVVILNATTPYAYLLTVIIFLGTL